MRTLEEEVTYLKRHFEIEIGLIKDENEILKRELNEMNQRKFCYTPNHKYRLNYQSPMKTEENPDFLKSSHYTANFADQSSTSPFKGTTNINERS